MLNAKINLYGQRWIDTVFNERNKEYGAYELRKKSSAITVKALIIGAFVFSLLVSAQLIISEIRNSTGSGIKTIDEKVTMVDLLPPPEETALDKYVPPPPVQEIKSLKDVKKFTPPVVAPENEVVEELVTQEVLKTADAGSHDVTGSADGEIVIEEKSAEQTAIVEDNEIHLVQTVQVQPEYPGGLEKFDAYIIRSIDLSDISTSTDFRIIVRFVIEKNGTLTDIQILRDGGFPSVARNVVRALEKAPKWKPGIINGKPVRVAYIKPIIIRIR